VAELDELEHFALARREHVEPPLDRHEIGRVDVRLSRGTGARGKVERSSGCARR
jgi:hypothetical protein